MKKRIMLGAAAAAIFAGSASAQSNEEVRLGILLGFTGPLESMASPMGAAAEFAAAEVSESGKLLNGATVATSRGDSTCTDASAATAAASRLVTSDEVHGIVGALCSGASGAVLQGVAVPNNMLMVSPSSTSPGLSLVEDNGLFFRTAPSDARQGQVMADLLIEQGVNSVAVTYTNNDYGQGLADSFNAAFTKSGGQVTISSAHEDGRGDYSAEIAELAAAGGDLLVVIGYVDQGGSGIVRASLDTGGFDRFHFPDGMISDLLVKNFSGDIDGSFGQSPGTDSPGAQRFKDAVGDTFDASAPFAAESYDAAALILLAMQAAGSVDPTVYRDHVMSVANAPGEKIFPGDLARGLQILADGGEIDYVGASAVEMIEPGESAGSFRQVLVKDGELTTVGYR